MMIYKMLKSFAPILFYGILIFMGSNVQASNKIVCILFDMSESTNKPSIRKAYIDATREILKKMNPGDVLLGVIISEHSISEMRFALKKEFPVFKPTTDNPLFRKGEEQIFQQKFAAMKDSLWQETKKLLLHPPRRIYRTEILSALQVAERVFESYDLPRKILVIFSDMIEDSRFYNFMKERLTQNRINQIVRNEKKAGRIPNLKGVKIYVVGATARHTNQYLKIKSFWFHYFQECGANIENQNYGPTLIRFDD